MTRRWCRSPRASSMLGSIAAAAGLPAALQCEWRSALRRLAPCPLACSQRRIRMLISETLEAALNRQIGREMGASLQYLAIAAHFDRQSLKQLARFFYRQADEERT